MAASRSIFLVPLSLLAFTALTSCDEPAEKPLAGAKEAALAPSATSALPPVVTTSTAKPKRSVRRPKDRAELIITDARRSRVEKDISGATGFLDLVDIEQKMFDEDLTRGKVKDAVKTFDKFARGKWVLFVGNIGKQEGSTFELPVRYTARDPKDPFGLSANWFPITFSNVEGYDKKDYRAGEVIAVLAKYQGKQQVGKTYDLVMLEHWDFTSQ